MNNAAILLHIGCTFALSYCFQTVVAQDQGAKQVEAQTLKSLRAFRGVIFKGGQEERRDSLSLHLNTLIDAVKKVGETQELDAIRNYVEYSREIYDSTPADERLHVMKLINDDLSLKLYSQETLLWLEGQYTFGQVIKMKINALINGAPVTQGSFRLFWGYFLGRDLKKIITAELFQGSSNHYDNPYNLEVRIPGYICFWLKDEESDKYYRPSFQYKVLDETDSELTINFQPLQ